MNGHSPFYENVHRMKHKDGHWVYILDRGKVMARDDAGQVIAFTGTHTDITPQKEAENTAIAALNARDKFFANMSHEIRTPMHGILGIAEILLSKAHAPAVKDGLSTIVSNGQYLLSLLNDILDLAKLNEEKLDVSLEPIVAQKIIKSVEDLFRTEAENKGLSLKLTMPAEPVWIDTDRVRFKQVISNLLSNALKFTDVGQISLKLCVDNQKVTVSVSDTGKGVKDTSAIFDAYQQENNFDAPDNIKTSGTGLGLDIVKKLSDKLGMEIEVKSTIGIGSEFILTMPLKVMETDILQHEEIDKSAPDAIRLGRVLIVDDNDVNRIIAKEIIKSMADQVDEAVNGLHAQDMARQNQYQLILMDLQMPDMDGYEATRLIRQLKAPYSSAIILALSANAYSETVDKCLNAGMDQHLSKPFDQTSLKQKISELI
jgi:CheY-like chemotaxis protein/nitrogen-specific signal transduction histidine kinase